MEPKEKPKEKIKTCDRCGSPMKKNIEKRIWECTSPTCAYDEAY